MSNTADILIIGGGVMGASIAHSLMRQGGSGNRVVLVERQALGNGTTGRSGAIVRQHYSNDFTIRMARDSLHIFQHFDDLVGGDCGFTTTGLLVLNGEQDTDALQANVALQQAQGVNTRLIPAADISTVAPEYSSEGVALACYEANAGVADPMATTYCFATRAHDLGATIHEETTVTQILTQGERVVGVRTTQGDISAPIVVLAANVWSVALASALGIALPITPTRHPMLALRRSGDAGSRQKLHAVALDLRYDIYLRPDIGGMTLVGSTIDVLTPSDPDAYAQGLSEEEIAHFRTMSARSIPALARAVPRGSWAGIYDDSVDNHPVLDSLSPYEGLYCAAGFSGHGFKLSPLVGQWMASYILTGKKPSDMEYFAFDRFARGEAIRPRYTSGVLG